MAGHNRQVNVGVDVLIKISFHPPHVLAGQTAPRFAEQRRGRVKADELKSPPSQLASEQSRAAPGIKNASRRQFRRELEIEVLLACNRVYGVKDGGQARV
jgi:hypothetical protein